MKVDALLNAFPSKTKVTLLHAVTGCVICRYKINSNLLPTSFDKPTNIEWGGVIWRIMNANPIDPKELKINNKLTLHVQDSKEIDLATVGYNKPTYCSENFIKKTTTECPDNRLNLEITWDNWHQVEFFPLSLLENIQQEMEKIEMILSHEDNLNRLIGFKKVYIRKEFLQNKLSIPLKELELRSNTYQPEKSKLTESNMDNFVLLSNNYAYYGTVENDTIKKLYLSLFESIDEELHTILSTYNLILVDWCNTRIIIA